MYWRIRILFVFTALFSVGVSSDQPKIGDCPYSGQRLSSGRLHAVLDQHLRWLIEQQAGKAASKENKAEQANLCNADLKGVDLTNRNLSRANLTGAKLDDAILDNINLGGADLTDASLLGASLSKAGLEKAILVRAQLLNANLQNAILANANLSGSDLEGSDMRDASLIGANLSESGFSQADLAGVLYEPRIGSLPNIPSFAKAINLNALTFRMSPNALKEVSSALKHANFQDAAGNIDYAIQYSLYRKGEMTELSPDQKMNFRNSELMSEFERARKEGNVGQAIDYGEKLLKKLPSTKKVDIRHVQEQLAALYIDIRDLDKAKSAIKNADSVSPTQVYNSLGVDDARNMLDQAKRFYEQKSDKDALNNLQNLIAYLDDSRHRSPANEAILADAYVTFGKIYASQGDILAAHRAFTEGLKKAYLYFQSLVGYTSEEQQFDFIQSVNSAYFAFLSFVQQTPNYGRHKHRILPQSHTIRPKDSETGESTQAMLLDVYRIVLQLKGVVLESQLRVAQRLRAMVQLQPTNPMTAVIVQKIERIERLNGEISLAQSKPSANKSEIQSLLKQRDGLYLELYPNVAIFLEGEKKRQIDSDLRNASIAPFFVQGTLIDFVRVQDFDFENRRFKSTWRYLVFLINNEGEIVFCDLKDAAKIDNAVEKLRKSLSNENSNELKEVKKNANALYKLAFRPFRHLISNTIHRLHIVPDGALNLVPFAALVDDHGKYLIDPNSGYSFTYLSSGRDIQIQRQHQSIRAIPPVIFADPDYGGIYPGINYLGRLISTKREAEAIKGELDKKIPGTILKDREGATKTNLLAIIKEGAPIILHMATHGFFKVDTSEAPLENSTNLATAKKIKFPNNSFLQSGLDLAGANENNPKDNGILTALEISELNLSATKLVVFSACETGVGAIRDSDGVYGLRRALVQTQAETHVMSLWKVDDSSTTELMTEYYKEMLNGTDRLEALHRAQRKVKASQRFRHPYYWAAFISAGAWGPLNIDVHSENINKRNGMTFQH